MPIAKGKINNIWSEQVNTKKGPMTKHFVFLEGEENEGKKFGGFGSPPENWKKGAEIEFEYYEKSGYFNIGKEKSGGYGGLNEVVKALSMPKVTLTYDQTEQVKQYEPVKISGSVSFSAEEIDPAKIDGMIDMLAESVDAKVKEKVAELRGSPSPPRTLSSSVEYEKLGETAEGVPTGASHEKGSKIDEAMKKAGT